MSGESWWLICVLPGWRIWRNSSHNCVPILLDKTVPVFMLLRWMCKGLGALIFPFCDQVIYFESFETQKIICHHFCFGGDESGYHRTSAYSALSTLALLTSDNYNNIIMRCFFIFLSTSVGTNNSNNSNIRIVGHE